MADLEELIERQCADAVCPVCGETSPGGRWICLYRLNPATREHVRAARQCGYSLEGSERIGAKLREVGDKIAATRNLKETQHADR